MKQNIYVDKINVSEIEKQKMGKDFIYNSSVSPSDLIIANMYTDVILAHISKYFSVIHKNIFFHNNKIQDSAVKNTLKTNWLIWNAKPADISEIQFESDLWCKRIDKTDETHCKNTEELIVHDLLIIVGFLGFPMLNKLQKYFKHIVCLDNSQECIASYIAAAEDNTKNETNCIIDFIPFTSNISDYVAKEYNLYSNADAVICGVGEASLFRSFNNYATYINRWLKPDGIASFSFYNGRFLYDYHSKYDLIQQSTYVPLPKEQRALVVNAKKSFPSAPDYYIYCKIYEESVIRDMLEKFFEVTDFYSYPSLLLSNAATNAPIVIQNIFQEYDRTYSMLKYSGMSYSKLRGLYITAFVQKQLKNSIIIDDLLNKKMNITDINYKNCTQLKTVILKNKEIVDNTISVILLTKNNRLPEDKNGEIILEENHYSLLTYKEINELGFESGCIPPFFSIVLNNECKIQFFQYFEPSADSLKKYMIESNIQGKKIILENEELTKLTCCAK